MTTEQPIRFAGSTLGENRHICAFFYSPEEEYRLLLPFIKEGFERGEKAFHKFSGDIIVDVMRTHPMIIIGGILQENPFFVPLDQFV